MATGDLNNDGWPDIYVTNDFLEKDYLYLNNQKGGFKEQLNQTVGHISQFAMGVDIADFNNDGLMDIAVADMAPADNYRQKTMMKGMSIEKFWKYVDSGLHYQYMFNTLQLNNGGFERGKGSFSEIAQLAGVAKTDWSWAPLFADFDNDGYKDLIITNGRRKDASHVDFVKKKEAFGVKSRENGELLKGPEMKALLDSIPINKLKNHAFKNKGNLSFANVSQDWGLAEPSTSTGAAYGDLDNDGDLDLVVSNIDEPVFLYENKTSKSNYLRINLTGSAKNTLGVGARVELTSGEQTQVLEQFPTRGYQSSVEPVLHFGLGEHKQVDSLKVTWADGRQQVLEKIKANQVLKLEHKSASTLAATKLVKKKLFNQVNLPALTKHSENTFDDFKQELLLPHKLSSLGPAMATGDIDGNGLDDLFVGGAKGFDNLVYLQLAKDSFSKFSLPGKEQETLGAEFFDADGDKDLDLYIANGSNEFAANSGAVQDQLYLNDGSGKLSLALKNLPSMLTSSMSVQAADFDNDGDQDLFVGGRVKTWQIPVSSKKLSSSQ